MRISDWSSDVCSSDLPQRFGRSGRGGPYCFWRTEMAQPLMPHATASWLVNNTALSFEQIAQFCGLPILEVHAIAHATTATTLTGPHPPRAGELTQEEIDRGHTAPDSPPKLPPTNKSAE